MGFSLDPLLTATLPESLLLPVFEDIDFLRRIFFIMVLLSVTYPVVHWILKNVSAEYRKLGTSAKQVTSLHHFVEALLLTVYTPFFSYVMIRVHFYELDLGELRDDMQSVKLFCMAIMAMYLYELMSRYENPRPVIILHHLIAILDGSLVLIFPTTVILKTASILVFSICFESLVFWGLFLYRVMPFNSLTPKAIMAGILLFGVTRPIQVLWVGAAAFGSFDDPNIVQWQAVMQFCLTGFFTMIQVWSIKINLSLWRRSQKRIQEKSEQHTNSSDHSNITQLHSIERSSSATASILSTSDGHGFNKKSSETKSGEHGASKEQEIDTLSMGSNSNDECGSEQYEDFLKFLGDSKSDGSNPEPVPKDSPNKLMRRVSFSEHVTEHELVPQAPTLSATAWLAKDNKASARPTLNSRSDPLSMSFHVWGADTIEQTESNASKLTVSLWTFFLLTLMVLIITSIISMIMIPNGDSIGTNLPGDVFDVAVAELDDVSRLICGVSSLPPVCGRLSKGGSYEEDHEPLMHFCAIFQMMCVGGK